MWCKEFLLSRKTVIKALNDFSPLLLGADYYSKISFFSVTERKSNFDFTFLCVPPMQHFIVKDSQAFLYLRIKFIQIDLLLLLSRFSRVQLCETQWMAAHQAPPSLGLSRQEHWSGLPFPSPMHESEKWKWSRSLVSNPTRPHGLQPTRLPRPWDFPGNSTGVGCHCQIDLTTIKIWCISQLLFKPIICKYNSLSIKSSVNYSSASNFCFF